MKYMILLTLLSFNAIACGDAKSDRAYLAEHNKVRAAKGIKPLRWGNKLQYNATVWADHLALNQCGFKHSGGPNGENIAKTWGSRTYDPAEVVKMWADEEVDYNYKSNTCAKGKACGHYTQIVWANTKKVGCAVSLCPDNSRVISIYVCMYSPPGNYIGQRPY